MSTPPGIVIPFSRVVRTKPAVPHLRKLIGQVQSAIASAQAVLASESMDNDDISEDFYILDDISSRHAAESHALYACSEHLTRALDILLETETSDRTYRTAARSLQSSP